MVPKENRSPLNKSHCKFAWLFKILSLKDFELAALFEIRMDDRSIMNYF